MAVTVFRDSSFKGRSTTLKAGKYPTIPHVGNDKISSVTVKSGFFVKLYVDAGFRGRSVFLFPGTYPTLAELNDKFSSMEVGVYDSDIFPSISFFTHANFTGFEQRIAGTGQVTNYEFPFLKHDAISSVRVPKGIRAVLFKDSKLRGTPLVLEAGDYPNLSFFGFNDTISSLQIIQNDLELIEIEYTNLSVVEGEPNLIEAKTQNGSDLAQKATLALETEYTETFTRSFSNSTLIGVEISVSASTGITKGPLSASLETTITSKFENTFTIGKEESESKTISIAKELTVTIPPRSFAEAVLTLTPVNTTVEAVYTFQIVGTDRKIKQNVVIEIDDAAVGIAEIKPFTPIS